MSRLWLTGEWLIQLAAMAGDECVEHREYVIGPLWEAKQAETLAFGLRCGMEQDYGLRSE